MGKLFLHIFVVGLLNLVLQRLPLGLQMLPAVPLALLIHAFPESPRWLAMKGRHEDALNTLARLHAHGNTEDIFVRAGWSDEHPGAYNTELLLFFPEMADITASIEKEALESKNA